MSDVSLWIEHLGKTRSCQVCGVGYSPGRYGEHATGLQHRNALKENQQQRQAEWRARKRTPVQRHGPTEPQP